MKLFKRPDRIGAPKFPSKGFACRHRRPKGPFEVIVRGGAKVQFRASWPMCQACTEDYLNRFSITCVSCGLPILPGTRIGLVQPGVRYQYAHLQPGCCDTGALYCGVWGEGVLISLHELHPEKYPEGTLSVLDYVSETGEPVFQNF